MKRSCALIAMGAAALVITLMAAPGSAHADIAEQEFSFTFCLGITSESGNSGWTTLDNWVKVKFRYQSSCDDCTNKYTQIEEIHVANDKTWRGNYKCGSQKKTFTVVDDDRTDSGHIDLTDGADVTYNYWDNWGTSGKICALAHRKKDDHIRPWKISSLSGSGC